MSDLRKIAQDLAEIQQEVNMVSKKAIVVDRRKRSKTIFVDDESWAVFRKKVPSGFTVNVDGVATKVVRNSIFDITYTIFVSNMTQSDQLRFTFSLKLESKSSRMEPVRLADFVLEEISPEIMAEAMDDLILEANKVLKDFPI
jgi:hypothetical protein